MSSHTWTLLCGAALCFILILDVLLAAGLSLTDAPGAGGGGIFTLIEQLHDAGIWNPLVAVFGVIIGCAVYSCIEHGLQSRSTLSGKASWLEAGGTRPVWFRACAWERHRLLWVAALASLGTATFFSAFGIHEFSQTTDGTIWPLPTKQFMHNEAPDAKDEPPWRANVVPDVELAPVLQRSAFIRTAILTGLNDTQMGDDSLIVPFQDGPGRVGNAVYSSVRTGGLGIVLPRKNGVPQLPTSRFGSVAGLEFQRFEAVVTRTNISASCLDVTGDWKWEHGMLMENSQDGAGSIEVPIHRFKVKKPLAGKGVRDYHVVYQAGPPHGLNMRLLTWMNESEVPDYTRPEGISQIFSLFFVAANTEYDVAVIDCTYTGKDVMQKATVTNWDMPIVLGEEETVADDLDYWSLWAGASRISRLLAPKNPDGAGGGGIMFEAMLSAQLDAAIGNHTLGHRRAALQTLPSLLGDILTDTAQGFYTLARQKLETGWQNKEADPALGHSVLYYTVLRVGGGSWLAVVVLLSFLATTLWFTVQAGLTWKRDRLGQDADTEERDRGEYQIVDRDDEASQGD